MQVLRTNKPTFDNPRDSVEITKSVGFDPSEIWLYDDSSGLVFMKLRLPEMVRGPFASR
jgi:hypothetical protein